MRWKQSIVGEAAGADTSLEESSQTDQKEEEGHSGEYGNAAKLVGKMSKSVMRLISIHF